MTQPQPPSPVRQKKQLTGFILLILMVVIAAPFVLRSPEEVRVALSLEIPPPPPVGEPHHGQVVPEEQLAEVRGRLESVMVDESTSEDLQPPPVEQITSTEPELLVPAWSVQLASFSDRDKAEALALRLRDAGYPCYIRSNAAGTLHRVFAGPEREREQAEQLRAQLLADPVIGMEGLVVSYRL